MTYRKLLLRFPIMATLALAGVWMISLWGYAGLTFSFEQSHDRWPAMRAIVHRGSIQLSMTGDQGGYKITSSGLDMIYGTGDYSDWGDAVELSSFGNFGMIQFWGWSVLWVPLWLPWLLFNGGAFVVLRLLERRSSRGKEKQLAERAGA